MDFLPEEICDAWKNREEVTIFATVDDDDRPNVIYVTCIDLFENKQFVIADNYFDKTRANILHGSKASLLFRTKDGKAYQIKGTLEYETSGKMFDFMKTWNPSKHPGHAAAILKPVAAYSGSRKIG